MDVVLDSNELIADRWLSSQRFEVFKHYLASTQSELWVLAPVLTEVREHHRRELAQSFGQLSSACEALKRLQVNVPEMDGSAAVAAAFEEWARRFEDQLPHTRVHIPFDPSVAQEAFVRAAARTAPCRNSGHGMRDAVIWLSVLAACRTRMIHEVAFVSSNTKDFAAADGTSLRPELAADAAHAGCRIHYYPSLANFNRTNSDRIAHITMGWVRDRVDIDELEEVIASYVKDHADLLQPRSPSRRDVYVPKGEPYVHSVNAELIEYSVWRLEPNQIVLNPKVMRRRVTS